MAEDLVAPVLAEVDVEIRHRHALGIEEALEQQAEAQRVEIGDGERPGDDRARARAAPRPDGNALSLRPLDELRDDEEISREAHLDDDIELEVEPLAIGLRRFVALGFAHAGPEDLRPQPQIESVPRHGAQLFLLVAAARRREGRQDRLARLGHVGAAPGDDEGIVDRLGHVGEEQPHRRRRLEMVLLRQPPPVGLAHHRALGDAQQHVMRLVEFRRGEEHAVGGDQRQVMGIGEIDQRGLDAVLGGQAVAHQLDIEPAGKQQGEPRQQRLGRGPLPFEQQPPERSRRPAGEQQQPVARSLERGDVELRRLAARGLEE